MATQASVRSGPQAGAKSAMQRTVFRRWQRFRLNIPIRLIVNREDSTRITEGRVQDISEGGVLIFAGIELRAGDKLSVEFTLPYSSTPVRAPGTVRHRHGYNYGVEFLSETSADQEQTAKFRNLLQLAAGEAVR
jgi:hypothetical protein